MSGVVPPPQWVGALRARANCAPLRPRLPLWASVADIGSVELDFLLPFASPLVKPSRRAGVDGWEIGGELTATLGELALAMRDAGVAHA
ncbi:MAG TPA: NUDIX hydrolase, partial [Ramlibacter sp.]|nr:NUDIX hydrolase [Ramlibacter sp.]